MKLLSLFSRAYESLDDRRNHVGENTQSGVRSFVQMVALVDTNLGLRRLMYC